MNHLTVAIPATIYLAITGEGLSALGLAALCAVIVGTIDNVLRPMLVGRDAQMSDLMVLVSTLGGLAMFGVVGLIIGPVIAGVFITIWTVFRETLAETHSQAQAEDADNDKPATL